MQTSLIQEADFDTTVRQEVNVQGEDSPAYPKDNLFLVKMYQRKVYQSALSEQKGEGVYKLTDYIELKNIGRSKNIVDTPITDKFRERFPKIYAEYMGFGGVKKAATALEHLDGVSSRQIELLNNMGISDVESLAVVPDIGTKALGPGGMTLKKKAKVYLEMNDPNTVELANTKEELAELKKIVANLAAKQAEATANPVPKKRGPKPRKPITDVPTDDSPERTE